MAQTKATKFGDLEPSSYPGERLGLPEKGERSVARVGRRLVAIIIDWVLAGVATAAFYRGEQFSWLQLGVFALLQIIFIPTLGGSIGQRICGMRVVPLAGGWVGLWRPVVRTLLLCIIIPALVWDSDQRGFHDKIAGTVLIRA